MCLCVYGTGYQQANVIMLPKNLADDFEEFCCKNPAPLPLLYRSQSGEASCPPLAKHADIRYIKHAHKPHTEQGFYRFLLFFENVC